MSVSPLLKDFKRERLAEYDLYAMETVAMNEKKKMLIQVTPDPNLSCPEKS